MSNSVDNRVVQLEMDNGSFEKNAGKSIKTLEKLDNALNFKNGRRSFEEVEEAAAKCNFKPLLSAADTVVAKFSAIEIAGIAALTNLTNKAVNAGLSMVKSLSIDQITTGYSKYEQKTANVQTLVNSTGKSIKEVNGYLDRLMWFSDETSYGFTDMTQALATMVSSGGDIDKIVPMIEGMANATAFAGKGASEFNRVIYNLNQSYSQGFLSYMDWKSVQQAGASSKQLVETLIEAGEKAGTIKKGEVTVDNFTDTLSKKWATREVMENAFGYFDEMTQKAYEMIGTLDDRGNKIETASQAYDILSKKYDGVSVNAAKAAQEAKSFTEAVDSTKDAVSSGWMRTFEIIFGDYEQAKTLWTDVANGLWNIFAGGFEDRNSMLQEVFQSSPVKEYSQSLEDAGVKFDEFKSKLKETYRENGKGMSDQEFETLTAGATTFEELLGQSWVKSNLLEKTIAKLPKELTKTGTTAKKVSGNISDLLKDVNAGKYGYGVEEQQKKLAEAGIDGSKTLGSNWLQQLYNANANGNQEVIDRLNETLFTVEEVTDAVEDQSDVWDDLAQKAKDFDNDGYYSKTDGRTIALDGLSNILSAVGDRLGVVKESWDNVFPPMTAERLRNMIISFHAFTDSLKMGSEESERLATVSERVFTVIGKVRDVLVAFGKVGVSAFKLGERFGQWLAKLEPVANAITKVKEFFDGLHGDTVNGLDSFTKSIDGFAEALDKIDAKDFYKFLKKMKPFINKWNQLKEAVTPVIAAIGGFFKGIGALINQNAIVPFSNFIAEIIASDDPIGTLISGVEKFGQKVKTAFRNIWNAIKAGDFKTLFTWLKDTFPGISSAIEKISDAFEKLTTNADGTKKSLESLNLGKIISVLTFAGLIAALIKIGEALTSVKNAADSIKNVFSNLNKIFVSKFGNTFAGNVRTVALAVVALAGSLWLLSTIPSDKLKAAAISIGVLMVILTALAGAMAFASSKFLKKDTNISGLVKPMLGLSASILILSFAVKNVAKALDGTTGVEETFTKVGAILALIGGLGLEIVGLTALMSLLPGKVKLMSVVMFVVAAAILKVASALNLIQDITLTDDAKSILTWIGIIMVVIAVLNLIGEYFSSKAPETKAFSTLTNVIVSLVAIIGGIYLALLAMEKLKTIKLEDITSKWKEAIAVIGIMVVAGAVIGIVGKYIKPAMDAAKNLGIGVLAIIAATYLVTLLVERLAKIGDGGLIDSAATALTWIIIVMAGLVAALGFASKLSDGGKGVLKIAASLLVVTASIALMVGLLKVISIAFNDMEVLDLVKFGIILGALVLMMGLLAIAVGKAGQLGGGKGTGVLIAAIVGVVALAVVLVVLTNFTWGEIWPGLVAIAGIMIALAALMVAIGVAVNLATKNKGGLGGLVAAVLLIAAVCTGIAVLSNMPLDAMAYACVAISVTMLALAICIRIIGKMKFSKDVLTAVGMLAAIVVAVILIVPAMQALAALPAESFKSNMIILCAGIFVLMAIVTVAAIVVGKFAVAIPALLAIAIALVSVGILCVAFAASMSILASVDYGAIANGLSMCAGPMFSAGGAGIVMALGAVGVILMTAAIVLLGIGCQAASGGIAAFSIAIEYLLGIFSAVGSAIQNSNGNIISALANLRTELNTSAESVEKDSENLQKSLSNIAGSTITGIFDAIKEGISGLGSSVTDTGSDVSDAMTTVVETGGAQAAEVSTAQGITAGTNWGTGFGTGVATVLGGFSGSDAFNIKTSGIANVDFSQIKSLGNFDLSQVATSLVGGVDFTNVDATSISNGLTSVLSNAIGNVDFSQIVQPLGNNFINKIGEFLSSIGAEGDTAVGAIETAAVGQGGSTLTEGIQTLFGTSIESLDLSQVAKSVVNKFSTGLTLPANLAEALRAGTEVGESSDAGLRKPDTFSSGSYFAQGFINGILSRMNDVIAAVIALAEAANNAFASASHIGSPSKLTIQFGKWYGEGFIIGVDYSAPYAAASCYNLAIDSIEGFNEGIQNGEMDRIVPVLDTSDIYRQISEFDGVYHPVIKPTLDMSDMDPAFRNMTAVATIKATERNRDAMDMPVGTDTRATNINYTQNNYSPKALSQVEIYRQTRNQLNSLERIFQKK